MYMKIVQCKGRPMQYTQPKQHIFNHTCPSSTYLGVDADGGEVAVLEQAGELHGSLHLGHEDHHLVEVQRVQQVVQLLVLVALIESGGQQYVHQVKMLGGGHTSSRTAQEH